MISGLWAANTTLMVDTPKPPIGLVSPIKLIPPRVIRVARTNSVTLRLSNGSLTKMAEGTKDDSEINENQPHPNNRTIRGRLFREAKGSELKTNWEFHHVVFVGAQTPAIVQLFFTGWSR